MKTRLAALVFFGCFISLAPAWAKTILPDACGDDKVKFDVKTEKGQSAPTTPAAGKAQVVLIENENHMIGTLMHATVRFGLDGAWAGANFGNSYFTMDVDPGEHHICASWQSSVMFKKMVDVASFTAEPGKIYYFAANVKVTTTGSQGSANYDFDLTPLNDDEGKYRVKAWKLSISKPQK